MITRLVLIASLLVTNISPAFADQFGEVEDKFMFGVKLLGGNDKRLYLSMEHNEDVYNITPEREAKSIKHELLFSQDFRHLNNYTEVTRFDNSSNRHYYQKPESNLNYSGYKNVEGYHDRNRSQKTKFATASIGTIVVVTGLFIGTVALVVTAL